MELIVGHSRDEFRLFVRTPPSVTAYPEETSRRLWHDHVFEAHPLLTA